MESILTACILSYGIGTAIGPLMEGIDYWLQAPQRREFRAREAAITAAAKPVLERLNSEQGPLAKVSAAEFSALLRDNRVVWLKDHEGGYQKYSQGVELKIAA